MDPMAREAFRAHEIWDGEVCVVRALATHAVWAQGEGLEHESPVFVCLRKGKATPFPVRSGNTVMRAHLTEISKSEKKAAEYSSHQSIRGGAETAMLHSGFADEAATFLSRRARGSRSREDYLAYARSLMAGKQATMMGVKVGDLMLR